MALRGRFCGAMGDPDSHLPGLLSALAYGFAAVAANFINKYALMLLPMPRLILLSQTATALLFTQAFSFMGFIYLPPVTLSRAKELLPVAMSYVTHAVLVLFSLENLSIPMYNTLKRLAPVFVLLWKAILENKFPSLPIVFAVAFIVSGCFIAGLGDLDFSLLGYSLAISCAAAQALYMQLSEHAASPPPPRQLLQSSESIGVRHRERSFLLPRFSSCEWKPGAVQGFQGEDDGVADRKGEGFEPLLHKPPQLLYLETAGGQGLGENPGIQASQTLRLNGGPEASFLGTERRGGRAGAGLSTHVINDDSAAAAAAAVVATHAQRHRYVSPVDVPLLTEQQQQRSAASTPALASGGAALAAAKERHGDEEGGSVSPSAGGSRSKAEGASWDSDLYVDLSIRRGARRGTGHSSSLLGVTDEAEGKRNGDGVVGASLEASRGGSVLSHGHFSTIGRELRPPEKETNGPPSGLPVVRGAGVAGEVLQRSGSMGGGLRRGHTVSVANSAVGAVAADVRTEEGRRCGAVQDEARPCSSLLKGALLRRDSDLEVASSSQDQAASFSYLLECRNGAAVSTSTSTSQPSSSSSSLPLSSTSTVDQRLEESQDGSAGVADADLFSKPLHPQRSLPVKSYVLQVSPPTSEERLEFWPSRTPTLTSSFLDSNGTSLLEAAMDFATSNTDLPVARANSDGTRSIAAAANSSLCLPSLSPTRQPVVILDPVSSSTLEPRCLRSVDGQEAPTSGVCGRQAPVSVTALASPSELVTTVSVSEKKKLKQLSRRSQQAAQRHRFSPQPVPLPGSLSTLSPSLLSQAFSGPKSPPGSASSSVSSLTASAHASPSLRASASARSAVPFQVPLGSSPERALCAATNAGGYPPHPQAGAGGDCPRGPPRDEVEALVLALAPPAKAPPPPNCATAPSAGFLADPNFPIDSADINTSVSAPSAAPSLLCFTSSLEIEGSAAAVADLAAAARSGSWRPAAARIGAIMNLSRPSSPLTHEAQGSAPGIASKGAGHSSQGPSRGGAVVPSGAPVSPTGLRTWPWLGGVSHRSVSSAVPSGESHPQPHVLGHRDVHAHSSGGSFLKSIVAETMSTARDLVMAYGAEEWLPPLDPEYSMLLWRTDSNRSEGTASSRASSGSLRNLHRRNGYGVFRSQLSADLLAADVPGVAYGGAEGMYKRGSGHDVPLAPLTAAHVGRYGGRVAVSQPVQPTFLVSTASSVAGSGSGHGAGAGRDESDGRWGREARVSSSSSTTSTHYSYSCEHHQQNGGVESFTVVHKGDAGVGGGATSSSSTTRRPFLSAFLSQSAPINSLSMFSTNDGALPSPMQAGAIPEDHEGSVSGRGRVDTRLPSDGHGGGGSTALSLRRYGSSASRENFDDSASVNMLSRGDYIVHSSSRESLSVQPFLDHLGAGVSSQDLRQQLQQAEFADVGDGRARVRSSRNASHQGEGILQNLWHAIAGRSQKGGQALSGAPPPSHSAVDSSCVVKTVDVEDGVFSDAQQLLRPLLHQTSTAALYHDIDYDPEGSLSGGHPTFASSSAAAGGLAPDKRSGSFVFNTTPRLGDHVAVPTTATFAQRAGDASVHPSNLDLDLDSDPVPLVLAGGAGPRRAPAPAPARATMKPASACELFHVSVLLGTFVSFLLVIMSNERTQIRPLLVSIFSSNTSSWPAWDPSGDLPDVSFAYASHQVLARPSSGYPLPAGTVSTSSPLSPFPPVDPQHLLGLSSSSSAAPSSALGSAWGPSFSSFQNDLLRSALAPSPPLPPSDGARFAPVGGRRLLGLGYFKSLSRVPSPSLPASTDFLANHYSEDLFGIMSVTVFVLLVSSVELTQTGTLLLCTLMNSALTTSIVGVLKGAVAVLMGFFLLGGVKVTFLNAFGIAINLLGGVLYVAIRHMTTQKGTAGSEKEDEGHHARAYDDEE